jgi:glycosyltransferase involved in cell wall biosynthesis
VNAIKYFDPGFQVVLCAGAPDTPEIAAEMKAAVASAQASHEGVIWIEEMVDTETKIELYSHAAVFVCPSIYEPFGIINLEAMACETPVVASAVGGIREVVVPGETGTLVHFAQMKESPFEALEPDSFSRALAEAVNELMRDPEKREAFGKAGRRRAEALFGWDAIAKNTVALYESLVKR